MPNVVTCIWLLIQMAFVVFFVMLVTEGTCYYAGYPITVRGIKTTTGIGVAVALCLGWVGCLN